MDDQEVGADGHDLAQLNLSWARAPLHSRVMAGFVARTTAVDEDLAALEAFVQGRPSGGDAARFPVVPPARSDRAGALVGPRRAPPHAPGGEGPP